MQPKTRGRCPPGGGIGVTIALEGGNEIGKSLNKLATAGLSGATGKADYTLGDLIFDAVQEVKDALKGSGDGKKVEGQPKPSQGTTDGGASTSTSTSATTATSQDQGKQDSKSKPDEGHKSLPNPEKEGRGQGITVEQWQAFQLKRSGLVDPPDEQGRREADIAKLADGIAVLIMSKINPSQDGTRAPHDQPVVPPANTLVDPPEPQLPKYTPSKGGPKPGPNGPVNPLR